MAAVAPRFICSPNQGVVNSQPAAGIQTCAAVTMDTTLSNGFNVLQSVAATTKPIGIAQEGSYYPPGLLGLVSDVLAAHPSQPLNVFGDGEECLWQVGSAAVTVGDSLCVDSTANFQGFAKTIAFTSGAGLIWQVARALQSGASGEKIRVLVSMVPIEGITA